MAKSNKRCRIKHEIYSFAILCGFLLSLPVVGFEGNVPSPSNPVMTKLLKINKIDENSIVVGERHFAVTEETGITDTNESEIQLDDISVPCQATVTYRLRSDQDPLCITIVIK